MSEGKRKRLLDELNDANRRCDAARIEAGRQRDADKLAAERKRKEAIAEAERQWAADRAAANKRRSLTLAVAARERIAAQKALHQYDDEHPVESVAGVMEKEDGR
jgi:hypothetical protein